MKRPIVVSLPIRTVSEANARGHWRDLARRARDQRNATKLAMSPRLRAIGLPVAVLLCRLSPRKLDDDNLRGAMKAVRDGVADALGLDDDSDERVTWDYGQAAGAYGVVITVRPLVRS